MGRIENLTEFEGFTFEMKEPMKLPDGALVGLDLNFNLKSGLTTIDTWMKIEGERYFTSRVIGNDKLATAVVEQLNGLRSMEILAIAGTRTRDAKDGT